MSGTSDGPVGVPERRKEAADPSRTPQPQRVSSETLLGPARELIIVHSGREYRLRRTQTGRLILTA
jgi:hemin uptake protein HemP